MKNKYRKIKRLLSLALALVFVLGMLPLGAFATEELCYTVTIGEETINYTDIDLAIDAACAATSATLTLHQDVTVAGGSLNFNAGNVTLDLNGRTIAYRISLGGSTLTIKDSATVKGTVINESGAAIGYHGGKLIIDSSVDVCGEAEGHEPWNIWGQQEDATVTIGYSGTENIVLPENYTVIDGYGTQYNALPSYTLVFFHRHIWSTLTCTQPKACSSCGLIAQEALGHSAGSDGVCTVCGHDTSKIIIINMTDGYGDGWNGNAIKIYENGQELAGVTLEDGSQGSWSGDYDSSKIYIFKWVAGSYAEECSFEVIVDGETVYTATTEICAALTDGEQFYSLCDHNYNDGVVTPPTCTEDGFTTCTCSRCNGVFIQNVVPSTGHDIGSDGACTVCGYDPSKLITINMTDGYGDGWNGNAIKIYENGQELAGVTLENGSQGSWSGDYDSSKEYIFKWVVGDFPVECGFEISICGEVVFTTQIGDCDSFGAGQQIYPVCDHSLEKGETVAPTCTDYGYTTYICALCGGIWEQDIVNSTGHAMPEDGVTVEEPTCTTSGYILYTCTTCGESVTENTAPALGHTPGSSEPEYYAPTCTEKGYYSYICDRCEEEYIDEYVEPIGHTLGDDGNCTVCGEPFTVPVTVSGVDVTVENMDDVLGDGTVSYDAQTKTLTLNGYTYDGDEHAVYSEVSLNIELIGNNTITTGKSAFAFNVFKSNIQISGTGTLEAETGMATIWAEEVEDLKLTIGGGVRIRFRPDNEEGIYMLGDKVELVIKDRAVLELGDEEAPLGEECIYLYGDTYGKVFITDHASITCQTTDEETIYVGSEEGTIDISGNPTIYLIADEEGMDAEKITISGGNITTIGGSGHEGIYAYDLYITGGTVIVGTTDNIPGEGIEAENITITGGTVTVNGGGLITSSTEGEIILGEGMAITEPTGVTIGQIDLTDDEGVVLGVLNADGTLAESLTIAPTNVSEKFDIDVARMILGNALEFQFGVAKTKIADTTGYYAVIEKAWADGTTTTKTIPATQWGTAGQYWAIVYDGLAAKEMADTFYVTIYNADGVAVSNAKEDSVVAYVKRAYAFQSTTGRTMMVDMLNYGAAAQLQFSYDTDNLANSKLTDEQKAVGTAEVATLNNNQVKGDNYLGTRFVLESRIQVQMAFEGLTSDMYAIYSYTDNNGKLQEVRVEGTDFITAGNMKGVELSALVYADARTLVKVLVYTADGTLYAGAKDSIESCSYRSGGDVFVALMKFADSAREHLY